MHMLKLPALALCAVLCGCATLNGVPQSPCQRATRAAETAHALANAAVVAGLDPVVIAKLDAAAQAATVVATGVCAQSVLGDPR